MIDRNLQLRMNGDEPNGRPVVILFQWMLAKRKHVEKYENFYLSNGFDVLTVQVCKNVTLWLLMVVSNLQINPVFPYRPFRIAFLLVCK